MFTIRRTIAVGIAVLAAFAATIAPAGAADTGQGTRRALLVYVTWYAGGGTPAATADKAVDAVRQDVATNSAWFTQASHNYFGGWSVQATGPAQIPVPRDGVACGSGFRYDVIAGAAAAARARGLDPASFNKTIVYFPNMGCPWRWSVDTRNVLLHGNTSKRNVVQSLIRSLAAGPAAAFACRDATGQPVPWSSSCAQVPSGDPFSIMGTGTGTLAATQQSFFGWLALGARHRTATTDVATYTLNYLESAGTGLQALQVNDGDGAFWLEYRRPVGIDRGMPADSAGVLVHRALSGGLATSYLLDMTPETAGADRFLDARLPDGRKYTSPSGISITVVGQTDTTATVTVRFPRPATPTVPNVIDKTESQAKSILQAAGYVPSVTYTVDDAGCDDVGLVVKQSPAGGTHLAAGATVTITVAKPPAGGCTL